MASYATAPLMPLATWSGMPRCISREIVETSRAKVRLIDRRLTPLLRSIMITARSSTLKCEYCWSIATPYMVWGVALED